MSILMLIAVLYILLYVFLVLVSFLILIYIYRRDLCCNPSSQINDIETGGLTNFARPHPPPPPPPLPQPPPQYRSETQSLPNKSRKYAAKRIGDHGNLSGDCCICLEKLKDGEICMKVLPCEHSFHKKCISMWLSTDHDDCPLCRTILVFRS